MPQNDPKSGYAAHIARWMNQVMAEQGWSASEWSRLAATSPTNVTRFLKALAEGNKIVHVPSSTTIAKLARVCGYGPEMSMTAPSERVSMLEIPYGTIDDLKDVPLPALTGSDWAAIMQRMVKSVAVNLTENRQEIAVQINSDSLNAGAVVRNDVVVCRPVHVQPPQSGDIVVARYDGELSALIYQPPWLLPKSTLDRYIPQSIEDAPIVGVAIRVIRDLDPRAKDSDPTLVA
tara:strand:+ start:1801 stop:2499 length:699 start_codon:yes stop_codon:yes gene_type:complete